MQQEPAVDRVVDEVVIHLNAVDSDSDFLETETEDEDVEERSDEAEGESSGILDVQSGKVSLSCEKPVAPQTSRHSSS
ncbi:unnamed protein product [Acanthoscelides obtectus]|uniref:Uncharacterized protein n=1 Tax=Acanthoscelides obtectus TaxID=200917 RepID=A0A9P0KIR4_ACAOB|nr:unnamed protein product [Acanthoscelides obtectus]CAK1656926.1 hypothetical protein AOBTE_LOCUS20021 [Acanthoscelides obtectus]